MDEKLTLNDGTEIVGHIIQSGSRLILYMYEIGLQDAFDLLIDPERTKVIRWTRYGEKGTLRGYKQLMSISVERGGAMICASLAK